MPAYKCQQSLAQGRAQSSLRVETKPYLRCYVLGEPGDGRSSIRQNVAPSGRAASQMPLCHCVHQLRGQKERDTFHSPFRHSSPVHTGGREPHRSRTVGKTVLAQFTFFRSHHAEAGRHKQVEPACPRTRNRRSFQTECCDRNGMTVVLELIIDIRPEAGVVKDLL